MIKDINDVRGAKLTVEPKATKIIIKDEYDLMRDKIKTHLENKWMQIDVDDDGGLCVSLTNIGLPCVYATISREEIQYQVDNDEEYQL